VPVEGEGSKAPASAPPHEIAGFLVQPAVLDGRDLPGRALDQRGKILAGEPTDLDAKALGLRVELPPVGEAARQSAQHASACLHAREPSARRR
jgi:hypothetical protein